MTRFGFAAVAFLCCLISLGASRRVSNIPQSSAAEVTPTNFPGGFSAFIWYEPSRSGYLTNAGSVILPNIGTGGTVYDLTNTIAAATPVREIAQLNGLDTLRFPGGSGAATTLKSQVLTNCAPFEMFVVLSVTNTAATSYLHDTFVSSEAGHVRKTSGNWSVYNSASFGSVTTNRYIVIDWIAKTNTGAAGGTMFTNNVSAVTNTASDSSIKRGMVFGSNTGGNFGMNMSVACIFAFTNQVLTADARLAAYQYCTNRFGL